MDREFFFTSESVTEGHPDKISDQVSDAILDAILEQDPMSHVACETLVTTGLVVVAGEVSTKAQIDIPEVTREKIREIGYDDSAYGFDANTCAVLVSLDKQSPDIAQGVEASYEVQNDLALDEDFDSQGAGDQGMMFGYACRESDALMPLPIQLAHQLCSKLSEVRKKGVLDYLRPDGKAQVTVRYEVNQDGVQQPVEIDRVVISTQHADGIDSRLQIYPDIIENIVIPVLPPDLYDASRLEKPGFVLVNPTGNFVVGGPMGDAGLTGRKIIVDTYGGAARHGGGAFSGKDPTKVDRSAAYAARWVAKNIVAAELADRCEIQLAYAIGVARPVSISLECFGTERVDSQRLEEIVSKHFDLRPAAILSELDLRRPIYSPTAAYGHFGRLEPGFFPWESTSCAEAMMEDSGL